MSVCTFFGHSSCPESIREKLRENVVDLIENKGVTLFYVGHQGEFDRMVHSVLRELKSSYDMDYAIVLAYLPEKRSAADRDDLADTLFPEGIEKAPKRFAISWRNRWMLQRSDYVITYVRHSWGGAAQFAELAQRQKKTVLAL